MIVTLVAPRASPLGPAPAASFLVQPDALNRAAPGAERSWVSHACPVPACSAESQEEEPLGLEEVDASPAGRALETLPAARSQPPLPKGFLEPE